MDEEQSGEQSGDISQNLSDNLIDDIAVETEESMIKTNVEKDDSWKNALTIAELNDKIKGCLNCQLGHTRKNFVFGSGNPDADIMVIGEAPGADEDEQGLPFVGRAGQLLTKILESINLSRDEVFICNIIKCRPPSNRRPEASEVAECMPYLLKQIDLIKPVFIIALGATAVESLLNLKGKMGDLRGKFLDFHGIKTLVTYHPAALLRNPNWKRDVWEDVKFLRRMYDEYLSGN
jgi:uracil-DNA glycosylase